MCLQEEGIDDNNSGVERLRQAKGLRKDDGGVGRGQRIRDTSKGSETTMEVAEIRRQDRGIYDDNGGSGGGR